MLSTVFLVATAAFGVQTAVQCCKLPFIDVFEPDKLKVCTKNKIDKNLNKWVNSFMLNKMQMKPLNDVNLNSSANVKALCKIAPFVNCVLRTYGITDQNSTLESFNSTNVFTHTTLGFQRDISYLADDLSTFINSTYPIKNLLMPHWNTTVLCPAAKKGQPKENVFIGWVIQLQFMQNYVPYNCKTIESTKKNKCNQTMTNFKLCTDAFFRSEFPPELNASAQYELYRSLPREQRSLKTILNLIDTA